MSSNASRKIPDEHRLLEDILEDYDTAARPVYNASHKVTVKFGLTVTQLADMVSYCTSFAKGQLLLISKVLNQIKTFLMLFYCFGSFSNSGLTWRY